MDETYFVRIENPVELRKDLLITIRTALKLMQREERLNRIRIAKVKELSILKSNIKEAIKDINSLKKELPSAPVTKLESIKKEKGSAKKTKVKEVEKRAVKEEVTELEKQLKDIESKIESLS